MQLKPKHGFLSAVAPHGVLLNTDSWVGTTWLTYASRTPAERYWDLPLDETGQEPMLRALLDALGSWHECWCWRPERRWGFDPVRLPRELHQYRTLIERRIQPRLPRQFRGALLMPRAELDYLIALALHSACRDWGLAEDTYFIPDHCQYIAMVCHHAEVHVFFRDVGLATPFVEALEERGYPLPTELREWGTVPDWMDALRREKGLGPHPDVDWEAREDTT